MEEKYFHKDETMFGLALGVFVVVTLGAQAVANAIQTGFRLEAPLIYTTVSGLSLFEAARLMFNDRPIGTTAERWTGWATHTTLFVVIGTAVLRADWIPAAFGGVALYSGYTFFRDVRFNLQSWQMLGWTTVTILTVGTGFVVAEIVRAHEGPQVLVNLITVGFQLVYYGVYQIVLVNRNSATNRAARQATSAH